MSSPRLVAAGGAPALLVSLVASAALVGCTATPDDGPSVPDATTDVGGTVSTVAAGLDAPWSVAFHGDTALVSERDSGRIVELGDDGSLREVGVVDEATPSGEGGLLGVAVLQSHLYTYFTAGAENRIVRYELAGEPGALALGPAETILGGIPSASYHDGGRIAFGPDGLLYITAGDAGDTSSAQDRGSLSGKILRLTPDGGVPDDNPFEGSPVYSYGHRNPQGIAWDEDGTMYASEFGQDTWDELNVIEPGGNYGWPEVEGMADDDRFVDPVQQWPPDDASPSGIAVADGSIWIANLRGERLREVPLDDLTASSEHLVGEHGRLRDAVAAPDGSLWVLTNNTDGRGDPGPDDDRVLRVDPAH
jgi:glucose/arabinose dehydrogenase